jgi:pyridoxal phosphate enzyme (YggS family)
MIKDKLDSIHKKIEKAAARVNRNPRDIVLVCAVKEARPKDVIKAVDTGMADIGENRVQDAAAKYELLNKKARIRWHFIGHLQTNKAKKAVNLFDLIHSVDSLRLANEIQRQAERINKMQSILLEVNISGEKSKYGIMPESLTGLIKAIREMKNLMLLGLMTMAPYSTNPEDSRPYFRKLRELCGDLSSYNCENIDMKHLSMGMSGDFEVAIEEGADMIRIGSAIFK